MVMPRYDVQHVTGVREGQVLAGKYRIEHVLGAGGMGVVVAAHHLQLDEKIALKFLRPEMLERADAVTRFIREARAAVKIKSEHVARVYDVGTLENGVPYMVMELLEGRDLAGWLEQRGPLPVEQAVEFVLQACVAVAEAHQLGIIHRDLKPANLFCIERPDGQLAIKVLDFGISKRTTLDVSLSGRTEPATLMGSPLYMSPEQIQSRPDVDSRADVWAMGIILYELVSGRVPFSGDTLLDIAAKITTQAPPLLRYLGQNVPVGLEAIIFQCLQKDRRDRFDNVAGLAGALMAFAPSRARVYVERIAGTLEARPVSSAPERLHARALPESLRAPETIAPIGQTLGRNRRTRKGVIAAVLGTAAAIAVTAVVSMRGPRPAIRADHDPDVFAAARSTDGDATPSASVDARLSTLVMDAAALPSAAAPPPAATSKPHKRSAPNPLRRDAPPTIGTSTNTNNCRLVSSFDAEGNQHFRQECGGN